jgi:hypothetical protein
MQTIKALVGQPVEEAGSSFADNYHGAGKRGVQLLGRPENNLLAKATTTSSLRTEVALSSSYKSEELSKAY